MDKIDFILLEACNFKDHPMGGQLNYARLLLSLFGERVATVGYTMDASDPVGEWFEKEDGGVRRMHFNLFYLDNDRTDYRIPRRALVYYTCRKYWDQILKLGCRNLYLQEHTVLMAVRKGDWDSVCYRFPGVESQLSKGRFAWAKPLSRLFDYCFYRSTRKADVLLASADDAAIAEMRKKSFGYVKDREVVWFPTRVDTSIFYPDKEHVRELGAPVRFVSSGRLHWVKGWDLVLDALALLKDELDFTYTYIGGGPDEAALLAKATSLGLENRVRVTGYMPPSEMAVELRRSDVYLMGSHMEGWPTTLVEAYVSGLPMVCTKVSGATTIISEGGNGFVCQTRQPEEFRSNIQQAIELKGASIRDAVNPSLYSIDALMDDLSAAWSILN
jgi:glycosyltransferase involved in cell wall biosynthesis